MTDVNETETTLDLDSVMRDGMEIFTGEPKADVPESEPITQTDTEADSPPEDGEAAVAQASDADAAVDTENADADADAPPAEDETSAKTPPEPKTFRFKSHEEAERGYRNIQSEKTRAEQKARELEDKLQALTRAEQAKEARGKAEDAFVEFAAERRRKALDAIDALDEEEPEYRKQVARLLAEADRDIHGFDWRQFEATPVETPAEAPVNEVGQREMVETMALDAGLNHEADLAMFRMVAGRTPEIDEQGRPMNFENQVHWAINETKALLQSQRERFMERQKQQASEQNARTLAAEAPMGRSAAVPTVQDKTVVPRSLDDAVQRAMDSRRL